MLTLYDDPISGNGYKVRLNFTSQAKLSGWIECPGGLARPCALPCSSPAELFPVIRAVRVGNFDMSGAVAAGNGVRAAFSASFRFILRDFRVYRL